METVKLDFKRTPKTIYRVANNKGDTIKVCDTKEEAYKEKASNLSAAKVLEVTIWTHHA